MNIPAKVAEVREKLRPYKGQFMELSRASNVSYFWILSFNRGTSRSPNIDNVTALDDYFKQLEEATTTEIQAMETV